MNSSALLSPVSPSDITMQNYTQFECVAPEEVGLTSASLLNFIDLAELRNIQLHSLMILRHGKVAAQLWWKPYAPEIPHHLYSFSKSFTATAIGFAIAEDRLSLDDRIVKFFPRRVSDSADPRIYSVTVRHLLTMTSGAFLANEAAMQMQVDWVDWFLNSQLQHFPGDKFIYNSLNTYMLSAILRAVTGVGLVDYLMPRLFEPLGIDRPEWSKCPLGIECGGWGLFLKTEDLAKFAQLYLDDGMLGGRRILPEGWVALASAKHTESDDSKFTDNPNSRSGYGFQFWRNRDDSSYRADGLMGQYGIVMPEKDMIIITTAGCTDQMKVLDLLWETIIPCVDSILEGSRTGQDFLELCDIAHELSLPVPKSVVRNRVIEEHISGRVFRFPVNSFSMIPFAIRYLYDITPLGIDNLRFDFSDDISRITWHEDGVDNSTDFCTDGRYTSCKLSYGGNILDASVYGAWISEDTLELDIRIIKTPHMLRAIFKFDGDTVTYSFGEDPTLEDSMKTLISLVKFFRPLSSQLAKFAEKLITPELVGKLEQA